MTERERDVLLTAAFDSSDSAAGQIARALAASNPVAHAELEKLKNLKSSLANLNDVPECQLGMERVRTAILRNAQKPRRNWRPAWLSAFGLATAAVAVLWFGMKQSGDSAVATDGPENLVTDGAVATRIDAESVSARALGMDVSDRLRRFGAQAPEPAAVAPSQPEGRSGSRRSRSAGRRNRTPDEEPIVARAMDAAPEVSEAVAEPTPVVVVTGQSDPETGAAAAREVESTDNVVFGG